MVKHKIAKIASLGVVIIMILVIVTPVYSQQSIEFKNHQAKSSFPEGIRFTVDLCGLPDDAGIGIYIRVGRSERAYFPAFMDMGETDSCGKGRYNYITKDLPLFVSIEYFWAVFLPYRDVILGPKQSVFYEDTRFSWAELNSGNIEVWLHDRSDEFGRDVLEISTKAVTSQYQLFGLDLKYPIKIVIFNNREEFFAWNVTSKDYIAGEAYPYFDLTVQIMDNDSQEWMNDILPHEISHLYFYQVTYHSESSPPDWLNEGLATYNEFNDHAFEENTIQDAVRNDRIVPLYHLTTGFGTDHDRVDLAYAESYSAVYYLIETYGVDALRQILRSYRMGESSEDAFNASIQKTPLEFEADWMIWLTERYPPELERTNTTEVDIYNQPVIPMGYTSFLMLGCISVLCLIAIAGGMTLIFTLKRSSNPDIRNVS